MSAPTTKAALKSAAQNLLASVEAMPNIRVIKAGAEMMVSHMDMYRSIDLHQVDHMREHLRREVACHLVDELLRSGAIKLTETLEDDMRRYGKVIRIKGSLSVC
jgi:hypothetical protein